MRPLRLELEGFSTFRERVVLDFDGLDLVAFTGPTGAGKSSLIDAITFALYGSVARYDHVNRVAPVIHQLVTEARVRLDFESGGRTHVVTRVVRRRSSRGREADGATTREARLERVEGDGTTTVLASEVRELNPAVEELLGLDFAQFTRTIVLPQGEFAAFLRDDQASRDKLLQRLLDLGIYERMGQAARRRAKEAGIRVEMLVERRERLAPPDDEELAGSADRVAALERFAIEAAERVSELAELDRGLDPVRDRVVAIDESLRRLEAVEIPAAVDDLDGQLRAAVDETARLDGALAAARSERDEAQARIDDLPDKGDLVRTQARAEQVAEARAAAAGRESEAAELAAGIEELEGEAEAALRALAEADDALRAARQGADAAGWRSALEIGQPCPVCRQEVAALPDHDVTDELERAERRRADAAAEAERRSRALDQAAGRRRLLLDEAARHRSRVEELEQQSSTDDGPPPAAEEIARLIAAIDEANRVGRAAQQRVADLERQHAESERAVASVEQRLGRLRTELGALRDALADLGPPALGDQSLADHYRAIDEWAGRRREELAAEREELAAEGSRLKQRRVELLEAMAAAAESVGVRAEPDRLVAAVAGATADASARLADAERRRAEAAEIDERLVGLRAGVVLDDALGRHLRAGGFSSWLLAEAVDGIVAKATVRLQELSDGQYSLVAGERSFAIIDHHNADEVRDVRTLSGGETFLASLALALALADSIAELAPVDAPQLDSMFLDEGFGTLDPATLDVVAGAIEELASAGRMIGVVTHVADLAERMPAQFRVTKGPSTSTVELVAR